MEALPERHVLAREDLRAALARDRHEVAEQAALDRARVLHADHHLRQQVLEHARRREVVRRADLAQVGHHRFAGLGAVDREARDHPLRHREEVVADPRHRQVRQDAVVGGQVVELAAALRRGDERGVRLPHALRAAGRARRVEHHRHVVGPALRDLRFVPARDSRGRTRGPISCRRVEARDALVVAQAARVVVVDVRKRGHAGLRLEHLVDLLLVLDDRVRDLGVVEHVDEVGRRRVLVHRHRRRRPRACAASIDQYRRGRLSPMIARCMPRAKPCAARPQASARTSSATSRHVHVCQMPRSFSRVAGWSGRTLAWCASRRGNVSRAPPFDSSRRSGVHLVPPAALWRGAFADGSIARFDALRGSIIAGTRRAP